MVDANLARSVGLAALIGCVLLGVVYQVPPRGRLQCGAWRGAPSIALRLRLRATALVARLSFRVGRCSEC